MEPGKLVTLSDAAERSLREGDPAAALARLQDDVRARPADAKLRVFLFQLLCVLGQWERALNQLKVASELDPLALPMAQMYGDAVRCEAVRDEVFEGRKSPMVLGQPDQWLALLIESRLRAGLGEAAQSEDLRQRAFEGAPASAGEIDGQPFEWIADADSRLGPVLEAIINGRYYWVPFDRLSKVSLEKPEDLRDLVWMPAQLQFQNGGEALALIPSRYPGSESSGDGTLALARKTAWEPFGDNAYRGLGQRILATDAGETPFLEVRAMTIRQDESAPDPSAADHA
ncbi:MAG TPA: type VI secretion system accessory protein TagJ [Vicinamibacterales bacterium]|jgi:type VI secretion system protein ImpE|nr:type VI secretion system accessory protein TagJ [Vicinamibacterales bacterium]